MVPRFFSDYSLLEFGRVLWWENLFDSWCSCRSFGQITACASLTTVAKLDPAKLNWIQVFCFVIWHGSCFCVEIFFMTSVEFHFMKLIISNLQVDLLGSAVIFLKVSIIFTGFYNSLYETQPYYKLVCEGVACWVLLFGCCSTQLLTSAFMNSSPTCAGLEPLRKCPSANSTFSPYMSLHPGLLLRGYGMFSCKKKINRA